MRKMTLNLGMLNNNLRGPQKKHTTAIISKKLDNFYYYWLTLRSSKENRYVPHNKMLSVQISLIKATFASKFYKSKPNWSW